MKKPRFLNDTIHAVLDYGVVVVFALAPVLLGITDASAILCYGLAAVHLAMTLLTDMPYTLKKVIPMQVHGSVELVVGLALVIAPWMFSALLYSGQLFFTLMGSLIFLVWVSSNYGDKKFPPLA